MALKRCDVVLTIRVPELKPPPPVRFDRALLAQMDATVRSLERAFDRLRADVLTLTPDELATLDARIRRMIEGDNEGRDHE